MRKPYKICILGYGKLLEIGRQAVAELNWPDTEIWLADCNIDNLAECVQGAQSKGYEVFVAGSANAAEFLRTVQGHLVGIQVEEIDYLAAIQKAFQIGHSPAMAFYRYSKGPNVAWYSELIGRRLETITYEDGADLYRQIRDSQSDVIIGASHANEIAEELGKKGVILYPGIQSIIRALRQARNLAITLRNEQRSETILRAILNNSAFGIVLSNEDNQITGFNRTAQQLTGLSARAVRGKQITDILPTLRTEKFLLGDQNRIDEYHLIGDTMFRCTQSKIIMNNEIIGILTTMNTGSKSRKKKTESQPNYKPAYETFANQIANSPAMKQMIEQAKHYADTLSPILLIGQDGTEQEKIAQCIHNASPCRNGPYIRINLAAIGANDAGKLLLGFEEAQHSIIGQLELANGGTAVLENLESACPQALQCIINVIETQRITRLGLLDSMQADIRFVSIINELDIPVLRPSVFHHLGVFLLRIPSLADRKEDIPELFEHMIIRHKQLYRKKVKLTKQSCDLLSTYQWPGNLYEMSAVCERYLQMLDMTANPTAATRYQLLIQSIGEKNIVRSILDNCTGDDKQSQQRSAAEQLKQLLRYTNGEIAEQLGISRTTLWRLLSDEKKPEVD